MTVTAFKLPPITKLPLEEYLRLEPTAENKQEYVSGGVVAMAGATREHNQIVSNLIREVGNFLKDKPCTTYPSDLRVTTPAHRSYFYPDATVVCGDAQLQEAVFDTLLNPLVIFEVMSEATQNVDRGYKFFYYQQIPSLQEYVLVDSQQQAIDIIRREPNGAWQFTKCPLMEKQIYLAALDCTLSYDDIYYRVQFPEAD